MSSMADTVCSTPASPHANAARIATQSLYSTPSRKRRDHRDSTSPRAGPSFAKASKVSPDVLEYAIEAGNEATNDLDLHVLPLRASSANGDRAARWIRKRTLSLRDEIVDQLYCTHSQKVTWTIHRPTRGWYMRMRASSFPQGVAINLMPLPAQHPILQAHLEMRGTPLLLKINTRIDGQRASQLHGHIPIHKREAHDEAAKESDNQHHRDDFTSITLEGGNVQMPAASASVPTSPARTSARDDLHFAKGHARRRSAGVSLSTSGRKSTLRESRLSDSSATVVAELSEGEGDDIGLAKSEGKDIACPGAESAAIPQTCQLVIAEHHNADVASSTSEGWLSWAKHAVAEGINQTVAADALRSENFSIWWIDETAETGTTEAKTKPRSVEILRFQDETSWWRWNESRRGRLFVQQAAVVALNVDIGMYISLALAYLDFLDDRNGYNAAADGG